MVLFSIFQLILKLFLNHEDQIVKALLQQQPFLFLLMSLLHYKLLLELHQKMRYFLFSFKAIFLAFFLTSATNFPEFSSPGDKQA